MPASTDALSQPWLLGALLSVAAGCLGICGLILQKAAQHHKAKRAVRACSCNGLEPSDAVRWCNLLRSPTWWFGLLLTIGHYPITLYALTFTPETTVLPLGAVEVALNLILAYGLLNERFTRTDMVASISCIAGMVVAVASMPHSVPGYMGNFPIQQLVDFGGSLFNNLGFAIYLLAWIVLLVACMYVSLSVSLTGALKPCVLPLLVGLFNSQFHFSTMVLSTLIVGGHENVPQGWRQSGGPVALVSALLAVVAVGTTCEGLRQLDCRFFVPATFSATTVMMALEDLLFFKEWQHMSNLNLVCFACGCVATVVGATLVSPSHKWAASGKSPMSSPLLPVERSVPLHQHQELLAIMEEHKILHPPRATAQPLEVIDLDSPQKGFWALLRYIWQWVPITTCLGVLIVVSALYVDNYKFVAFSILTAWGVHNGWKFGLHMALFSYVGQRKMAAYEKSDFLALHRVQQEQQAREGGLEPEGPRWEDVRHFVILPNYKEDIEVLRLAIRSIAATASNMAERQIAVVLAMEEREKEAKAKALILQEEFADQFWNCVVTFHPPDLPGETQGKSANVKWAASKVLEVEIAKAGLRANNAVITVADADSEFHFRYFEALTYQFVHAGCGESETPDRYLSIWQPPILHYKNYHTQPSIVRLASLFTSQHELANLADPNATKVPYSTYSISATLAEAVSGWDPNWISEDWHMGMKCFLATAGRIRIQPIFLGVMNYAPEGRSYGETISARWTQAKRHALGFSEIVFFLDHFPRVLMSIEGSWSKRALFVWRSFFLWSRCLLIHVTMATMLAIGPLTALIMVYFMKHQILEDVNSWTFLTYCVFQSTGGISVVLFMFTNVLLYELTRSRIDRGGEAWLDVLTKNRWTHFIWVTATSMALMPFFFFAGGMAEWIAAVKTAKTQQFEYEVAMKPNLSQAGLAAGNLLTVDGQKKGLAAGQADAPLG